MMILEDFRAQYANLCQTVLTHGELTAPRGQQTREMLNGSFVLLDPRETLLTGIGRSGYSPAFAAVEAAQLVGGYSAPQVVTRINPTMRQFMQEDEGGLYQHGAYGPRIRSSMIKAVRRLSEDADTRQALVTIYDDQVDYEKTPDVPCTVAIQFTIRNDRLNAHVVMRSNDVWWGLGYDVFQFTQLQLTVANVLGIEPGKYFHTAHSLHAYERDAEAIQALASEGVQELGFHPTGFTGDTWMEAQDRATQALTPVTYNFTPRDRTEDWYVRQLAYVSPRATA